jgi:pimeloyl-ACP methyl ester carboxylesterase
MGFAGADDYYAKASASLVVDRIAVPTLVVHADDDPFVEISAETQAKLDANPNITNLRTAHGGPLRLSRRTRRLRRPLGREDGSGIPRDGHGIETRARAACGEALRAFRS